MPQEPKGYHNPKSGIARARMYRTKYIDWLYGFPVAPVPEGVLWMVVPRNGADKPKLIMVNRERLQNTTRTYTKLINRFPVALPHAVEDYDGWVAGVPLLLNHLKQAIHHGNSLPTSPFADEQFESDILGALRWHSALVSAEFQSATQFIQTNQAAIDTVQAELPRLLGNTQPEAFTTALILTLCQLARRDGAAEVAPFLGWLGDQRLYRVATVRIGAYFDLWKPVLKTLKAGKNPVKLADLPPESPDVLWGLRRGKIPKVNPHLHLTEVPAVAVSDFVYRFAGLSVKQRAKCGAVIKLLEIGPILKRWHAWWKSAETVFKQIWQTAILSETPSSLGKYQRKQIVANYNDRLDQLVASMPEHWLWHRLFNQLEFLCRHEQTAFFNAVLPTLSALPQTYENVSIRHSFLTSSVHLRHEWPRRIINYLKALREYLFRFQTEPNFLIYWHTTWHPNFTDFPTIYTVGNDLCSLTNKPSQLRKALTLFGAALPHVPNSLHNRRIRWLANLSLLTLPQAVVLGNLPKIWDSLDDDNPVLYLNTLKTEIINLLNPSLDSFFDLLTLITELDDSGEVEMSNIKHAAAFFVDSDWSGLVTNDHTEASLRQLARLGHLISIVSALDGVPPAPPTREVALLPDWAEDYPSSLHPSLCALAALGGDSAETSAKNILKTDLPDRSEIQRQIKKLNELIPQNPNPAPLQKRVRSLQNRLDKPATLSAKRSENLASKIEQTTQRLMLEKLQVDLADDTDNGLKKILGQETLPSWATRPATRDIIRAVLELKEQPSKRWGLKVFAARCQPPPWHFANEPANHAFLSKLTGLGIDWEPWVNPPPPVIVSAENGQEISVGIETDPLETFHMGGHFKTCLSPGDFNFFSVVTNIIDINKQVVFARTSDDRVIGRCLLALTQEGKILTFAPYCHNPDIKFENVMRKFSAELAWQMKTSLVPRGNVSTLVADDWYDDGPHDLTGQFDFLEYESSFRKELSDMPLDSFLERVRREFGSHPLNAINLTYLISLSEFNQRPELIKPLLPLIIQENGFRPADHLKVAFSAYELGEKEAARQLVKISAVRHYIPTGRWYSTRTFSSQWFNMIINLDPATALLILRRTRPHGVRKDEDETDLFRRNALADAHDNFGRKQRAIRLRKQP